MLCRLLGVEAFAFAKLLAGFGHTLERTADFNEFHFFDCHFYLLSKIFLIL